MESIVFHSCSPSLVAWPEQADHDRAHEEDDSALRRAAGSRARSASAAPAVSRSEGVVCSTSAKTGGPVLELFSELVAPSCFVFGLGEVRGASAAVFVIHRASSSPRVSISEKTVAMWASIASGDASVRSVRLQHCHFGSLEPGCVFRVPMGTSARPGWIAGGMTCKTAAAH